MSLAALLALLAGGLAVVGAWEGIAAVEQASMARALSRLVAPLAAARREGRAPTAPERRRLEIVGSLALLCAGWLVGGVLAGVACAAAGPLTVRGVLRWRRARWCSELARGAPAAARALADALSGGHSVRGAMGQAAASSGGGATGRELRAAARALALGESTAAVLDRLRSGGRAWETIVAAILLQRDAGGDLAGLLRSLAADLEDAARVEADARSATAQARFTAWIVMLLPVGAAVIAELARPGFAATLLAAPLAPWMLGAAALCQVTGCVLVARIARVAG